MLLRPWLFAVCHDEEYARVAGLPVRALNLLLAVTTAVTVTVAMRAVGLLLVSALMVVPVAAAQQVTRGFRATMTAGHGARPVAAGGGVLVSAAADTAPGATIVLVAIAGFFLVTLAASLGGAPRRRATPGPTTSAARAGSRCLDRDVTDKGYVADVSGLPTRYEAAGELLRALSAPIRIAHRRPSSPRASGACTSWSSTLGAPQPLVSQHLRVLRGAGVVRGSRRGREIAYALVDDHIAHIVADAVSHAGEVHR